MFRIPFFATKSNGSLGKSNRRISSQRPMARRLRHEPLEQRTLLAVGSIAGTVFEDLDANGVQDAGEAGLAGWTVALDRTDTAEPLLTIPNPTPADDWFGCVAAMGNNVLIGASRDDTGAEEAGAAYLFDGTSGALLNTFLNPTPEAADHFGYSVAALGNNVLVSVTRDDTAGTDAGAVYLFDSTTGDLLQTFVNPTPAAIDGFGVCIAAVGNNVIVGAHKDDAGATDSGAAYVFDGTTGQLLLTLLNPTPAAGDRFGWPVAAVGGNVLVGANYDDTGAADAGAAYLFDGTTGALLRTFVNPTPEDSDHFGSSLAAVGNNVLVSAPGDDAAGTDAGAVYLFDGSTGELLHTFLHPTPEAGDEFGDCVRALGNNVLVSAPEDDTAGTDAGAVYLFDGSTGELLQTFFNPTPEADDGFGGFSSIAAVGNNVLVSARRDDTAGTDAGAAYLFEAVVNTATDASGNYSFTGLEPGDYVVSEIIKPGYTQTAPGGDGTHTVTITTAGENVTGQDFGNLMQPTYESTDYQSTDVPKTLKDAKNASRPGVTRSTLTVPDSLTISDVNVTLSIDHANAADLDVFLIGPDDTRVELFTDIRWPRIRRYRTRR